MLLFEWSFTVGGVNVRSLLMPVMYALRYHIVVILQHRACVVH